MFDQPVKTSLLRILLAVLLLVTGTASLCLADDGRSLAEPGRGVLSFSDQTKAAGLSMVHSPPLEERPARMTAGAAAGDFNNDGWVDLFVIGGGLRSDALFINMGDGTFEDRTIQAGLNEQHLGAGAAVGDYDGDGWLDIYVTSWGNPEAPLPGKHRLYRNNGDLTFTDVAAAAGVNRTSLAVRDGFGATFGDYDLDGDLDLYVAGWFRESLGNRLFHNNGDGTFEDVTDDAGLFEELVFGFSPCFADMNGDRHPELVMAADLSTSRYYINDRDGTFTEFTRESGTGLDTTGMGSALGDWNGDGLLDWYVSAVKDAEGVGRGEGGKLYTNLGNHRFQEEAAAAGVDAGGWGWGTIEADLNHDGLLDMAETNGWIYEAYVDNPSKLWLNNGDGTFQEVAEEAGFAHTLQGRGILSFDYDRDGDRDLVVTAWNDELRLYRNDLQGAGTNWLQVILDTSRGRALAPNGVGSSLTLRIGEQEYYRDMLRCSNYLTQSEPVVHFGLGGADTVNELRVEWANGTVTVVQGLAANQVITVAPPRPRALPTFRGMLRPK